MSPLRKFLQYVKPYWHYILLAALGGFIKFLLPMIFPQVMRYFIDDLLYAPDEISETLHGEYLNQIHFYSLLMIGLYIFVWWPGTFVRSF